MYDDRRSGWRDVPEQIAQDADTQDAHVVSELQAELEAARKDAADQRDSYLRLRAEMENFKKRIERQYADQATQAKKQLLLKLLGVLDNLDRALSFQESGASDQAGLATGLRMTLWQMRELLKSEGITEIQAVGAPFDPRFHEAVATVIGSPEADGRVAEESLKGYEFQGDVLRPAKVVVTKGES
jgi:molecular chaperone GrpE